MKRLLSLIIAGLLCISIFAVFSSEAKKEGSPVIFEDKFERIPLDPWFQVDGYARHGDEIWQGTGTVAIEDGELSIITDSYWYNVYGVCLFETAEANFELSVSAKIMTDSASQTNLAIGIGEIAGTVDENTIRASNHIAFGYIGTFNWWRIAGPPDGSPIEDIPGAYVNIGEWTNFSIRKVGSYFEFYVNDELVRARSDLPSFSQINYVFVGNGVGVHWEGGTHAHWDNILLCTPGKYEGFARLAEGRAAAYAAYADAVYYFTPEGNEQFYRDLVKQAFVDLNRTLADLLELELVPDVYKVEKAIKLIQNFKEYLDGLEEAIIELIPEVYQTYASRTYNRLRSIEDLCREEADAWRAGKLGRVIGLLQQEDDEINGVFGGGGATDIADQFCHAAKKADEIAYEVARSTWIFLHKDGDNLKELQDTAEQMSAT